MRKLCVITLLLLTGCYEHIPNGIRAGIAAELYLDTIYGRSKTDEIGLNDIPVKDYLNPAKRKQFEQFDTVNINLSVENWANFFKNVNAVLSKDKRCASGTIAVERYNIKDTSYTTAFFVDSTLRSVLATVLLIKLPDTVNKNVTK